MLRGLGFNNKTAIFLASRKIYKAEKSMGPLLEMFHLHQTKEELAPFKVWIGGLTISFLLICPLFSYVHCFVMTREW
jgi:hypothetical protein